MKTVELPEIIYADLAVISRELSAISKKPISLAMATSLLISVYRAHMSEPCARDAFHQKLTNTPIMSPEEFEKATDVPTP
jgi:hypothetical protein